MAGESPDKLEQRKSSGETTREKRDPRLAAFRTAEVPGGGARGGGVLADEAGEPGAGGAPEAERSRPDESAEAGVTGPKSSDGPDGPDNPDSPDDRKAADESGTDDSPAGTSTSPAGTSTAKPTADGSPGSEERLRAAVAAWVAGTGPDELEEDADIEIDHAQKPQVGDDAPEVPDADGSKAAAPTAATPTAVTPTPETSTPGSSGSSGSSGTSGTSDEPTEPARADLADDRESDTGDEADSAGEADSDSGNEGDSPAKAAERPAAKRVDQPTTTFAAVKRGAPEPSKKTAPKTAPKADPKPEPEAKTAAEPAAKTAAEPAEPTAEPAAKPEAGAADRPAAGAKPVDRPTTAFKAVRPPAGWASKPGGAQRSDEESPAERTSRFVPLKSSDDPATSKPPMPAMPPTKPTVAPGEAAKATPNAVPGAPPTPRAPSAPSAPPVPPSAPPAPPALAPAAAPTAARAPGVQPGLPEAERTKQQPLPPEPPGTDVPSDGPGEPSGPPAPLDLLAALTNTPPKRETPTRTIVRRFKIWTPIAVLLAVVFAVVQAARPLPTPTLPLTAPATHTFDGAKPAMPWPTEGQGYVEVTGLGSLGTYGAQKPLPIGSVAKVMTAYVILKEHPLKVGEKGPLIPVDKKAEDDASAEGESVLDTVKAGDKINELEAIKAIMIPSANNIARLLARWDGGSETAFVKKMNAAAKDLGMKNTTYTDPSGLREATVSTAVDQVKLGKMAMQIPALKAVTKLPSFKDTSGKTWQNYNRLVPYDGAVGIKTGSTTKAGGNLLFAGEKQVGGTTQLIVGAVLGQHKPSIIDTVNAASKKVLLAAQATLKSTTVVKKGDVVGKVDDGLGGTTPVIATKDVTAVGWSGLKVRLALNDGGKTVPHEAKAGTVVGTLTVGSGPGQVKVPVALQKALTEPAFGSKLTRVG
ncbi:D-alanyl-D-alanine carboxypeptidase [Streptomyces sp. H27-D2]|uniref:D-alanyl-D-alanine carboxypeptidase n=1 Tax=Streptomyces sp. H27-D2 TaxID=3046304 RepID=UPI002DBF01A5|nr:D-alanyl-D-alanine carboxypeptidase [Streptomyces sp. H27-D2]MEC4015316.1 D-alanyl-D-alanine carboxypeptidase [Streptomyces sp. H27-D2]